MSAAASLPSVFTPVDEEEVLAELLLDADDAREDAKAFFEFVLRDETAGEPIAVVAHQELIFEFVAAHRNCVLMIPVNHAKCHGKGTPVLMADGATRPIETIRKGEMVMGHMAPTLVLETSSGHGRLYRVTPKRGGDPFVCNEDHILTLIDSESGRIDDVCLRDWLGWSRWKRETSRLVRAPVRRFAGECPLPLDPYFLGVWFGDGLHSVRNGVKVTSIDAEVRSACLDIAHAYGLAIVPLDEQTFGISKPGGKGSGKGNGNGPNPLMEKIREAVGGDELSMAWARTAPWADRAEFLAGFIDADGHAKDGCVWIIQKREDWARDIAFIARSLGLRVCEGTSEHPEYGTYRRLVISGGALASLPIRIPRKRVAPAEQPRNSLWTAFEVEALGDGDFYGFTIGGDGRYLLGDFTVTHNTFTLAGLILFLLGQNNMLRGAVVSAAEAQAQKPLQLVRQYIEASPELQFVFPRLRRSQRHGEPWTTTDLTIDRPPGIRDPSLVARGSDSKAIPGSRWGFCLVDDLSNAENTNTPEQRDKTYRFVTGLLKSRMDPLKGRVVVTCVAWHRDDTTHRLMAPQSEGGAGWPGMIMRASGAIQFRNAPTFDSALIRPDDDLPADNPEATYRLVANDHLPEAERTLWPGRWSRQALAEEAATMHPVQYAQNYENVCRDDSTALCKQEYIDKAMAVGRRMGITRLVQTAEDFFKYNCKDRGAFHFPKFGGVDLAFSQSASADECAIFIIGVLPDPDGGKFQIRVPLWVESGKWGSDELGKKLLDLDTRFGGSLPYGFENNGAQEGVRKLLVTAEKSMVLKEHTTGATKSSIELGVPSIFGEMANGAWAIPNDGRPLDGALKKWVDQCLYYTPSAHTGDLLMASYFARDIAKRFGAITRAARAGGKKGTRFAASLSAR